MVCILKLGQAEAKQTGKHEEMQVTSTAGKGINLKQIYCCKSNTVSMQS